MISWFMSASSPVNSTSNPGTSTTKTISKTTPLMYFYYSTSLRPTSTMEYLTQQPRSSLKSNQGGKNSNSPFHHPNPTTNQKNQPYPHQRHPKLNTIYQHLLTKHFSTLPKKLHSDFQSKRLHLQQNIQKHTQTQKLKIQD
ncbi:hypothetical protein ACTFIW_002398 [Dictyostelium discoideum]